MSSKKRCTHVKRVLTTKHIPFFSTGSVRNIPVFTQHPSLQSNVSHNWHVSTTFNKTTHYQILWKSFERYTNNRRHTRHAEYHSSVSETL